MKLLPMALICLCSLSALAQNDSRWLKSSQPDVIKKSVLNSVNWNTLKCAGSVTEKGATRQANLASASVKLVIDDAQSVYVKTDSTQPLIFIQDELDSNGYHFSTQVMVMTTADKKAITSLELKQKVTTVQVQNTGTIDQPKQESVTVLLQDITGSCK